MSALYVDRLDSKIPASGEVREAWDKLKPVLCQSEVSSRTEAYTTFSRVLKISNGLGHDEEIRVLWQQVLEEGCFTIQGTKWKYDFKTVLSLFKEGRTEFNLTWIQSRPEGDGAETMAEDINAIMMDSIGTTQGTEFFRRILRAPIIFSMVAKTGDIPVACTYGTYVEAFQLFHFNFLGRKIDYPGVRIIERLQNQLSGLRQRFPELQCVTLCVWEVNGHAEEIYRSLGFELLKHVEKGFMGRPMFFYGRRLNHCAILPGYEEFKQAYDAVMPSAL